MTHSLLSCVGMRDPYDARAPQYFGALLACALKVKASRITMITTRGTEIRAAQTRDLAARILPGVQVEMLDSGIDNPSDFAEVDRAMRLVLKGRFQSEGQVFVNLSSGTPQMTLCLSTLMATNFFKAVGVKASDPAGGANQEDRGVPELQVPSEADKSVWDRTALLERRSFPLVEHVTRANALRLCDRYDYSGAQQLLVNSSKHEQYENRILPLLRMAEALYLLRVEDAQAEYEAVRSRLVDEFAERIAALDRAMSLGSSTLLYLATQIKLEVGRLDDFIRCAGLTREVRLNEVALLPAVSRHYQAALLTNDTASGSRKRKHQDESPGLKLDRNKLEQVNPALLEYLEAPDFTEKEGESAGDGAARETTYRLRSPLTAKPLSRLIKFASPGNQELEGFDKIFTKTENLANLRNLFAHTLRAPEVGQLKCCTDQFKLLARALDKQEWKAIKEVNPFLIINDTLSDLLKFWQDDKPEQRRE